MGLRLPSRWAGLGLLHFKSDKYHSKQAQVEVHLAPFERQLRVLAQFGLPDLQVFTKHLAGRVMAAWSPRSTTIASVPSTLNTQTQHGRP